MSDVSHHHPWPRLAALIQQTLERPGESYRTVEARARGEIGHSSIENIVKGKGTSGKWPVTVPKLKALARGIDQPWAVVRDAVNLDTGTTVVAEYDGARVVLARAQEELSPEEMDAWKDMAADLIELVRRRRGGPSGG